MTVAEFNPLLLDELNNTPLCDAKGLRTLLITSAPKIYHPRIEYFLIKYINYI